MHFSGLRFVNLIAFIEQIYILLHVKHLVKKFIPEQFTVKAQEPLLVHVYVCVEIWLKEAAIFI